MITGPTWFGVKAAEDYPQDDDYHSGETHASAPNRYGGKLAERLGLAVWTKESYASVLRAKVPGQFAMKMDGTRAACDFTASAPKSVSIVALVLGEEAAARAHEVAVSKVADYLSEHACYRITEGGQTRTERAEESLYVAFTHATSRKRDPRKGVGPGGDPQLHTHVLFPNYVLCKDGKMRALENYEMVRARLSAGAVYRAELARQLQRVGYKLKFDGEAFEVDGIPKDLIDHFSTGRKSIIQAAKDAGLDPGCMSARQRDSLNRAERDSKIKLDRAGLRQFWSDRSDAVGKPLTDIRLTRVTDDQVASLQGPMTALEAVDLAIAARTERSSTIRHDYDLIQTAIHESNYSLDIEDVRRAIAFKRSSGDLVVIDAATGKMTTRERLANESAVDRLYERGIGQVTPMGTKNHAIDQLDAMEARMSKRAGKQLRLTDGQRHAVIHATITTNRVSVWEGDAGVGKSTSFEALLAVARQNGLLVKALGPHGKAVEATKASGLDSWTIQKAFCDKRWWKGVDDRTLLVLDEFGKVDAETAAVILRRAEECGARVVCSGDTKQWAAVAAGSPAHQLYTRAKQSGDLVELNEMMRATNSQARVLHNMSRDDTPESVLEMFRQGRVRAFEKANQRYEYIGREFAQLSKEEQEKALVITGMNRDRVAINEAVRKHLKLPPGLRVTTYNDKKLERPKLRNHAYYEEGDVIRFATKTGTFGKGEAVRIVKNDDGRLLVERKSGKQQAVDVKDIYFKIGLGSSEHIEVSRGELIQFTQPDEKQRIVTKAAGRVEALDIEKREATVRLLDDKRVVTVSLKEFGEPLRYGYCLTSDGAQGATGKGRVWAHMTSDDPTLSKNAWYTNVTRSTNHFEVVTDMKEAGRIIETQKRVSKALKPDFADPKRKPADTSVVKVDFIAGNQLWANVGAANIRFARDAKDEEVAQALAGAREKLGDKWHATGTAEFQRRVARLVGEQEGLEEVSFRHPKLNEELAKSRARSFDRNAAQVALQPKAAVNADVPIRLDSEAGTARQTVELPVPARQGANKSAAQHADNPPGNDRLSALPRPDIGSSSPSRSSSAAHTPRGGSR